jgi:phosphocarrier protein HPr
MRVHTFIMHVDVERQDLIAISAMSSRFMSDIRLEYAIGEDTYHVDVKSLLGMLSLPIKAGTELRLVVKGKDDEEVLEEVYAGFQALDKRR